MDYSQALEYIHGAQTFGIKPGLDAIKALLEVLGNPQDKIKVIHVAGTNGKGSTVSYMENCLIEGGYKVGTYISPSLFRFEERIKINGRPIEERDFVHCLSKTKEGVDILVEKGYAPHTEFEIFTAMAFWYFQMENVDFAIMEVGLGGRLDATNVVKKPEVCVLTPIALDHGAVLGHTYEEVAKEKAGIIKKGVPVVSAPQEPKALEVIKAKAHSCNAPLTVASFERANRKSLGMQGSTFSFEEKVWTTRLIGKHQVENGILALTALKQIQKKWPIKIDALQKGVEKTLWPCRLEQVCKNPTILLDGAHNPHGAKALYESLKEILPEGKKPVMLVGVLADKEVDGVLEIMSPLIGKAIATEPDSPRKETAETLEKKLKAFSKDVIAISSWKKALSYCCKHVKKDDVLVIFGSFYLVGPVRQELCKNETK